MLRTRLALALLVSLPLSASQPIDEQMREVEKVRGIAFDAPVEVVTVPRTDLARILEEQIAKSSTLPVGDYLSILRALQLIESEDGALDRLMEIYQSQVLAFYDPDSRKYYTFDKAPGGRR